MAARLSKSRSSCRFLILFLFGGVDFMNALYQWNAAAKAVQIGARIAAVSDPIASGLTSIANNAVSSEPGVGRTDARLYRGMRRRRAAFAPAQTAHATEWVRIRPRRWGSSFMGEPEIAIARLRRLNISPECATSILRSRPNM